jgi:plastocyanin
MTEGQRAKVIGVLTTLLGAAILLFIAYAVSVYLPGRGNTPVASSTQQTGQVPPPSPAVMQQLKAGHGFQAFVSITDSGFISPTTTIKAAQTIRFSNDSSHDVWIGEITSQNTPRNPDTSACNAPFNVCHALHPGDFVELTFPSRGTFHYMDDLNTSKQGAVIVK